MGYINQFALMQTLFEGKAPDSKALLADVDFKAVARALERSKDGLPKPIRFTDEPIEEEHLSKMPAAEKARLWLIYSQIEEFPEQALSGLLALNRRYPDVPAIYNYIGLAYNFSHQERKFYETILETTERFPDYLFGKTALAEYYLNKGEHRKVPKALDGKLELGEHYPDARKHAHLRHVSSGSLCPRNCFVTLLPDSAAHLPHMA